MALRSQYEFLFVGRDDGNFVENYAYDLGEGSESSGKIFINLEIQNNPADAESLGETIFDAVRRTFYSDLDIGAYGRFEEAVKQVNRVLNSYREEKHSKYIGTINAVISAIVGNTLYVTQCGEAEGYLIRRRQSSTITEGLADDESSDIFSNIASGTLEPGDLVLMGSVRLLRYISKTDLSRISSGRNLVTILTELKDFLSNEVMVKVGVVGVLIGDTAPSLSDKERGQIVAHLKKEEVGAFVPADKRKSDSLIALKETVSRLTSVVEDLRKRLVNTADSVQRGVRESTGGVRGSSGPWTRDRIILAFIVTVLVLAGGIWWVKTKATEQQMIDNYAKVLSQVQEEIASAETAGQYNKDQAGQMLEQAQKQALEVLNSGYHRSKANELLKAINDGRDKLDGVVHPAVGVLVDLSQKRSNVNALGLMSLKGVLYAYEYNALYPIILDKVQDPLTIDENETVIGATVYGDKESLMFYTKTGKVIEYKDNRMSFVDTADGSFHKAVAFQAYSNKLYLLDPEQNQIWRYTRRRDKFDAAEAYNVNGDLKNGVSLSIDGSIYVLNNDGFITKLFSGNQEPFPIKKQPIKGMKSPTKIFTQLDMPNIYVLEPSERRVLIFSKDDAGGAQYVQQFVFDDLTDLRDLFVDKDTNKMYLMDSSKVYTVNL